MTKSMNKVFLMGHLGRTPELQQSKAGRPYTRLSVATNRRWTDADEGTKEATDWHSVFVWGALAQRCVDCLQRGALVFVEGSLTYWSVAQESTAVYKNAIHGHEVRFLTSPKSAVTLSDSENLDNPEEAGNHNAVAHLLNAESAS